MKDLVELRRFFRRTESEDLVLCTIVRKAGSSYRDVFAKKLISLSTFDAYGLLSGGCLEREIENTARQNQELLPVIKTFSTLNEEDRLLGYQKGCAGEIDILFEKIPRDPRLVDLYFPYGSNADAPGVAISLEPSTLGKRKFIQEPQLGDEYTLVEPWTTPVQLSVIGCGADADPYLELAQTLGWSVRFIDYRSDLAHPGRFAGDVQPELIPLTEIAACLQEGPKSAVVLMTHSFESDLHIYSGLLEKNFAYLGCVGPRRRYDLLKSDLKEFFNLSPSLEWEQRVVKAPPGITPAEHTPTDIAFSIVADIQIRLGSTAHGQ
jgi:xanthine dehydrogenase accessory factor